MTPRTVLAKLSISTWRLKRLLNQVRFYEDVYLEIGDGEVVVAHPPGEIATYCTFNEYYFNLISTDSEGIIQAVVDVEEFYQYVKMVGGHTTVLSFLTEGESDVATELKLEGELNAQIHLTKPSSHVIRWNRVENIADSHNVEVPDVEDPLTLAQLLHERITGIPRKYPETIYQEIVENSSSFNPASVQIQTNELQERFDANNVYGTYEEGVHKPMPTRAQVTVGPLCDIISGLNSLAEVDRYQLIIDGKEVRVKVPGISGELSTEVPAISITGPGIRNEYGKEFEWIPTLSDTVELQTAPDDAPLAIVQRDKGRVIRHVIAPA